LPADAENTPKGASKGEFFMATIAPDQTCVTSACTTSSLAYWTWTDITTPVDYSTVTLNTAFTPGCFNTGGTYQQTVCVPQPNATGYLLDSVGDRLMTPLAYRYFGDEECHDGATLYPSCEYLAVTQTEQVTPGSNTETQTGIAYFTMTAPTTDPGSPTLIYQGVFYDTTGNALWYWLPSNAIDEDQNVVYTFTGGNSNDTTPKYPTPYMDRISDLGVKGTVTGVGATGGGSNTDDQYWEESVSVAIDPQDNLTFWGTGEFLNADQTSGNCCTWETQVFICREGSGNSGYCQ
jgi:hypothetical protein